MGSVSGPSTHDHQHDHQKVTAWCALAEAALTNGEAEQAEAALRIALALGPPAAFALSIGQLFERLGRTDEAVRAFRIAVDAEPNSVEPATLLGRALIEAGDRQQGIEQLRRAAELSPGNVEAWILLGRHLLEAGQRKLAIAALREASQIAPEHQPALEALGRCLGEGGEEELAEARVLLEQAVLLDPEDGAAWIDLGVVLSRVGETEAGFCCFREGLARAGESAESLVKVGLAAHAVGDSRAAIRFLREAVRKDPNLVEASFRLGVLLLEQGAAAAAVVALERAVTLDPSSAETLRHLCMAYQSCGDLRRATEAIAEAARLAPDDAEIQRRLLALRRPKPEDLTSAAKEDRPRTASRAMVGSLHDFALPDLLQLLHSTRRSGVLYLSAGEVSGEVSMVDGDIVSASSPSASLGKIVRSRFGVGEEQLRKVLGQQQAGDPQLIGSLLVGNGLLRSEQLREALETQVKTAIAEIVTWKDGRFAFEPGLNKPEDQRVPRLGVQRVLLDAMS